MKSRPRLYCLQTLSPSASIHLEPRQVHYLRDVLRMAEHESVSLFNEQNGEWSARIVFFKKDKGECAIESQIKQPPVKPAIQLILLPALIKRDAMDWTIEKSSELGIHQIQPVITARTQISHTKIERLQTIAEEAAEQCDRLDVPTVKEPLSLHRFLDGWPKTEPLLFAAESGDALPAFNVIQNLKSQSLQSIQQIGFLIGPEGGFTDEEHALLRRHDFVRPLKMGPRLMRAETASIALFAAFQAIAGDWKNEDKN